jgi:lipid-binding SYLF domain-containing protein
MFQRPLAISLVLLVSVMVSCPVVHGQNPELENRLNEAASAIREIMEAPDSGIPRDLLRRSQAIVIFPSVLKVGFGFGGQYGKGVALRKETSGSKWGPPAFFSLLGASVGWQMGVQSTDLVLVVMSEVSLKGLFRDKFTIGVDASVAAGPIGRDASAATDIALTAGILSYSRAKGLFMGISISGGIIEPDWDANEKYYGSDASIVDIFFRGVGGLSPAGGRLVDILNRNTKAK